MPAPSMFAVPPSPPSPSSEMPTLPKVSARLPFGATSTIIDDET
ncbi:hypothetical protein [Amycolatopsis jejuensis]|nr:hypothetical protein [Amycolatopsis jejuensis]